MEPIRRRVYLPGIGHLLLDGFWRSGSTALGAYARVNCDGHRGVLFRYIQRFGLNVCLALILIIGHGEWIAFAADAEDARLLIGPFQFDPLSNRWNPLDG